MLRIESSMLKLYKVELLKHGAAAFFKSKVRTTAKQLTEILNLCILIFAMVNFNLMFLFDLGFWQYS